MVEGTGPWFDGLVSGSVVDLRHKIIVDAPEPEGYTIAPSQTEANWC